MTDDYGEVTSCKPCFQDYVRNQNASNHVFSTPCEATGQSASKETRIRLVAFPWADDKNMRDDAKVVEVVYYMENTQRGVRTWKKYIFWSHF